MKMYQIGDRVVYGMHGVCNVADLEKRSVDGKQVIYLVLEPTGQQGSRYLVPTHNQAAMAKVRPLLHREDLEGIFSFRAENLPKSSMFVSVMSSFIKSSSS